MAYMIVCQEYVRGQVMTYQNYFKDKPTTLNLQIGLRMNIGRW